MTKTDTMQPSTQNFGNQKFNISFDNFYIDD